MTAPQLIGEYNTGYGGEIASVIPIASNAGTAPLSAIFRIPIEVEEGDILFVAGNAGFTHTLPYNVSVYTALLIADNEDLNGTAIGPVSGITITDTTGAQHLTFPKTGSYVVRGCSGLVYVGMSAKAASTTANGADLLNVDNGYGNFSVLHYRPQALEPPYVAHAVSFGGATYLARGGAMGGAVDSKQVTISCWVKKNGGDGSVQFIIGGDLAAVGGAGGNALRLFVNTSNNFYIIGTDTAGSGNILNVSSTVGGFTTSSGWAHVLFSCDLANPAKRHLYINDVADLALVKMYTNAVMDLTLADWSVAARPSGADRFNGDLADLWVSPEYIDLSVAENRRKFISTSGKPVDLGPNGTKPTGNMPLLYFSRSTSWHINRGKGGGMNLIGALPAASTSPSD